MNMVAGGGGVFVYKSDWASFHNISVHHSKADNDPEGPCTTCGSGGGILFYYSDDSQVCRPLTRTFALALALTVTPTPTLALALALATPRRTSDSQQLIYEQLRARHNQHEWWRGCAVVSSRYRTPLPPWSEEIGRELVLTPTTCGHNNGHKERHWFSPNRHLHTHARPLSSTLLPCPHPSPSPAS